MEYYYTGDKGCNHMEYYYTGDIGCNHMEYYYTGWRGNFVILKEVQPRPTLDVKRKSFQCLKLKSLQFLTLEKINQCLVGVNIIIYHK